MSTWKATYRCRKCGRSFRTVSVASNDMVRRKTMQIINAPYGEEAPHPALYEMHYCDGDAVSGNRGLADFVGWEYEGGKKR